MNFFQKFLLIFLFAYSASAQYAPSEVEQHLIRDFAEELKTADFVSPEVIQKYSKSVTTSVQHNINLEIMVKPIKGNKLNLATGHAISDVKNYVQQRIGSYAYEAIQKGLVNVKVFSGTNESFFKNLDVQYPQLKAITKLPSLYEEWGIAKYLVQEGAGKPTLILKIPTSYRYAQHYATMIRSINDNVEPVVEYDFKSEMRERYAMTQGALRLTNKIGKDYSVISFGYSSTWIESLKDNKDWKFISQTSAEDAQSGLNAEIINIENTKTGKIKKILLISSDKTVWGELATMMIGAFMHKKTESVIFMGSAGAVSDKNSVYDLSVPKRFLDKQGRVQVENILNKFKPSLQKVTLKENSDIKINFQSTHGNTFSPIEQNRAYLAAVNDLGIDTIDVEQSLLAREITEFNVKNKTNIKFGAINLVTDKPFALLQDQHAEHDLDRIDMGKKKKARAAAVKFLLGGLASADIYRTSCAFLFD